MIAKLDRLARNVHFVTGLIESGVDLVASDMPHADKVMIQMYAVMSEWERDAIGKRTKAALDAAKARGVKLGQAGRNNIAKMNEKRRDDAQAYAERLRDVMLGLRAGGLTHRQIVESLNKQGDIKPREGGVWHLRTVQRVLARLEQ